MEKKIGFEKKHVTELLQLFRLLETFEKSSSFIIENWYTRISNVMDYIIMYYYCSWKYILSIETNHKHTF